MSLVLGTFNSDSIDGLKAILRGWPVLPVSNAMEKLPGGGSLYYGSRVDSADWTFKLELTAVGTSEILNKSIEVSNQLNPLVSGETTFIPNAADGWEWQGLVKSLSDWRRDKVLWFGPGKLCRMTSTLVVTTPDPYGRKNGPALQLTTPGSILVPVIPGGYTYYPYMEFRGTLVGASSVTIGGTKFNTQLTVGQTLVIDHENMDYFIKDTTTGVKVRNVADRIETFNRLGGGTQPMSVALSVSGGTINELVIVPKFRRV